jgi:hypothetical protein
VSMIARYVCICGHLGRCCVHEIFCVFLLISVLPGDFGLTYTEKEEVERYSFSQFFLSTFVALFRWMIRACQQKMSRPTYKSGSSIGR